MKTEELIALKAAFEDRPVVQHGGLVCGRAEEQAMLALNYMDRMVLALHERDRALEECRDILRRFVMVTESGTESGLTNMKERKGRCDWYARMRPIREEARQALSESSHTEDG